MSKFKPFVSPHVHVRSLDTASTPENFAKRELELGTGYLTVTDHGTLEGTRRVYDLLHEKKKFAGLRPILGLEAYVRDDNCPILAEKGVAKGVDGTYRDYIKYYHITLHAMDPEAYFALSKALSKADLRAEQHGKERKPLFDWSDLEELGRHNITATSGCLIGIVARHLMEHNDYETAIKYYEKVRGLFKPGNFYVEVFPHVCNSNWESSTVITDTSGKKHTFRNWKKLKTDKSELKAEELGRAPASHKFVYAVMNNRKFEDFETPIEIASAVKNEGFVLNECKPWAKNGDLQLGINKFMVALAKRYGDRILISDDAHFAVPKEKIIQDIRLAQSGDWRFANSYHRFSSDEAWEYFRTHMGVSESVFEGWIDNTREWASRFDSFKFSPQKALPTSFYPQDTLKHVSYLIKEHGRMRWDRPDWVERLRYEMRVLHKNNTIDLLPYFFIDEEVVRLYASHGRLTGAGRGSAAGVMLSYVLGITHVPPTDYMLSFERFINPTRIASGKFPDIDQDLPDRDLLVGEDGNGGWLQERFGACVAQISTDTTIKLKSAIKDTFRARLGHVPPDVEAFTKSLKPPPQGINDSDYVFGYKDESESWIPGLIETSSELKAFSERYKSEWEIITMLLGMPRSRGRHACGFLIADQPIENFIPLQTVGGVRVTSFDKDSVEKAGGIKMDFLIVKAIKDVEEALKIIRQRHGTPKPDCSIMGIDAVSMNGQKVYGAQAFLHNGTPHDIWNLPSDPLVFKDICDGGVESVFQLDADAARLGLPHFAQTENGDLPLNSIESLSAFTALDRPGPLDAFIENPNGGQHNMLVEYARRARGEAPCGELKVLTELIPETFGVIVYQEQLQSIFQTVGGTTPAEADEFRGRIGKKKFVEVDAIDKPRFMAGAKKTLNEHDAEALWGMMFTFGQYGFNKSHAVSYMFLAYACAWLKHYYPLEWWCGVLRNASRNKITEKHWQWCGHLIDLPDIKRSAATFNVVDDKIQAPISLLTGVGEKAHEALVSLMMTGTPVRDIEDFVTRIENWRAANGKIEEKPVKKKGVVVGQKPVLKKARTPINDTVIRNLIVAGTLDSLFPKVNEYGGEFSMGDKLLVFESISARVRGKKSIAATGNKFDSFTPIQQFQMRKAVLQAFTADLSTPNKKATINGVEYVVLNGTNLEKIQEFSLLTEEVSFASIAYVNVHRYWTYIKDGETREACEFILDVGGYALTMIRWGGARGLPDAFKGFKHANGHYSTDFNGAVVSVAFNKRPGQDLFFVDVAVEAPPLSYVKQEEESADDTEQSN